MNQQPKHKSKMIEHNQLNQRLAKVLYALILAILVIIPFHGFLTTWAGSNFDNLLMWRAWKELLLIPAGLVGALLVIKDKSLRRELLSRRRNLLLLLTGFALWQIINTIFGGENTSAATLGLAIHIRWVAVFTLAMIASYYIPVSQKNITKILLIPASAVVIFGILQMFVLPHEFLKYFGYEKNVTIPPFFTIDEQLDRLRIASTLRGPNPLGVYLLVPVMVIIAKWRTILQWLKMESTRKSMLPIGSLLLLVGSLVVLYGSHSRGAWLGLIAALATFVLIKIPQKLRLVVVGAGIVLISVGVAGVYQYRNTNFVQDVVLHDNPEEGGEVSSNEGHIDSLKSGLENIGESPLVGCGVGCAGPASAHNTNGAQLSENYFVQTAEESGLIGLILLLAIFGYILYLLTKRLDDPLVVALLTSFVGISVAALTVHAWADDTISYLWWGIMGLYLYNKQQGLENGKVKTKNSSKIKEKTHPKS